MIIVMSPKASQQEIDNVIAKIEERGLHVHLSAGQSRTIIGVIGDKKVISQMQIEVLPGVEKSVSVTESYKLVSREFKNEDSIIDLGKGVKVGGKKAVPLDIRIIATSNRDMAEAVARGVLREDVYYRLNVFPLLIPALRQRPDDIVPLAQHFLAEHGGRAGRPGLCLSPSAEDALRRHPWPGNVRELENVMQRAVIFAAGDAVEAEALHLSVLTTGVLKPAVVEAPVAATPASDAQRTNNMRDLEREHILETLAAVGGSRKLASEKLGMSERTLRYKLKQYREAGLFKE